MKKILSIVTLIVITGCNDKNPDGSYNLETVVVDSCEYINAYNRLAHKGNCVYCKNRREKEIEELANKLK